MKEFRSKLSGRNKIKQYIEENNLELEKIIDEYSGYIYKIIDNMNKTYLSNEDIEEIVSDTFFIVWKNRNILNDEKKMSSYLAGITRNLVKLKSRNKNFNTDISEYENTLQDLKRIELLFEEREKINIIEKLLNQMKEDDRMIFNLYYYSSLKVKDIAEQLNVSEFNIKSRLYRIRKKIKKGLEKGGYSDGK